MRKFVLLLLFVFIGISGQSSSFARDSINLAVGTKAMVSTQEAKATEVGLEILKRGGNAVDATVAIGFALAVTYPQAGNLGGGGFMLIHRPKDNFNTSIDYREVAPAAAHRDMFLDEAGNVDYKLSMESAKAAGVPGTVAGLIMALEKYGSMSLEEVIQPAIELAEEGFEVTPQLNFSIDDEREILSQSQTSSKLFFDKNGNALAVGELFKQPELAETLKRIAKGGVKGFYEGKTAELIAADSAKQGGIMTLDDLKSYKALERKVVKGTYRDYEVITMTPPSSGGVHLIQMLNILEGWDVNAMGYGTVKYINHMVETMRYAYADRTVHLGDPAFYEVPVETLTSKDYASYLRKKIEAKEVRPSSEIMPGKLPKLPIESDQTTHYSVVDQWGNAVANTYTLNGSYGNGHVVEGAGFLLNNEMDDFSAKPGAPNMYGLVGDEANSIAPGKRPLSSMTPTIITKDGKVSMVTGAVGGSRIITAVLQTIVNVLDHGMDIEQATTAARFHHQYLPDEIRMEQGFNDDVMQRLKAMGYRFKMLKPRAEDSLSAGSSNGWVQSIHVKDGNLTGNADIRRNGALAKGY